MPAHVGRVSGSASLGECGSSSDYKKSVHAQLGRESSLEGAKPAGPARAGSRSLRAEVTGVRAETAGTLEREGEMYTGVAEGPASTTGRRRLVGQATLNAVEKYTNGTFGFALEDVVLVTLGHERVAVSCVILVTPLGEQPLAGSALARGSENDSLVRATLDAINRRLGFLTTA